MKAVSPVNLIAPVTAPLVEAPPRSSPSSSSLSSPPSLPSPSSSSSSSSSSPPLPPCPSSLGSGVVSSVPMLSSSTSPFLCFFSFRLIWRNFGLSFPKVGVTNILSGPIINIYWLTHPTCEVSQDLSRHRRVGKIRIFI